MINGTCVCTNGYFTLFSEYPIYVNYCRTDAIVVISDDGHPWFVNYQGDGYYGCVDANGKEVSFLVE